MAAVTGVLAKAGASFSAVTLTMMLAMLVPPAPSLTVTASVRAAAGASEVLR